MAEQFDALTEDHIDFIHRQHIYFVGTGGAEGKINVSPKGMDSLRVINPNEVVWLNLTGSGNETAAHVLENDRMTIMFCSFERQPLILRLYGTAELVYPRHQAKFRKYLDLFNHQPGARQFFEFTVDMVQTSCGYAVPHYEMTGQRETLAKWAANKGEDGIADYWAERNLVSLDGKPTQILED
jgi:hypothetical protein